MKDGALQLMPQKYKVSEETTMKNYTPTNLEEMKNILKTHIY